MTKYFKNHKIRAIMALLFILVINSNISSAYGREDLQLMAYPGQDNYGVNLAWYLMDPDLQPVQVDVWVKQGMFFDVADMQDAEKIATLTENDWQQEKDSYQYFLAREFDQDYFSFYISVSFDDGITIINSNVTTVGFFNWDKVLPLTFTSTPESKAYKGIEYKYQAVAIDTENSDAIIEYSIYESPEGMTIDSSTGLITWTPTENGEFNVFLHAKDINDENKFAEQYFSIYVLNCQQPALLSGIIKDSKGNLIKEGYVNLLPENFMERIEEKYYTHYSPVINGEYKIEADEGKYYMVFQDKFNNYEFYEGVQEVENAKLITLNCGESTILLDWTLTLATVNSFVVKGSVTTEEGYAAPYVAVYFRGTQIDADGHTKQIMYSTSTDSLGLYSIELPELYTYIAYVDAYWEPTTGILRSLYYNQTYNPNDAEKILLTQDIEGINFVLSKNNGMETHTVTGNVSKEDGTPIANATVVFSSMLLDEPTDFKFGFYEQAVTDEAGNYSIELWADFDYLAYAVYQNGFFGKPLYYNQTYNPEDAESISVDQDLTGINFVFAEPDYKTYKLSGVVKHEDGNPVAYATVIVEGFNDDPDYYKNRISLSTTTDSEGKYEFELPDILNYTVYAFDSYLKDRYNCMMPLYYNQTYNPEEAELIQLNGDRNDINFTFAKTPEDYNSSMSGTVENETGDKIPDVLLMAYLVEGSEQDKFFFDSRAAIVDNSGEFKFMGLVPGKYIILAIPKSIDYLPGFYKENEVAVLNWDEAAQITVAENQEVSGIKVILGKMSGIIGLCQATGSVQANTNSLPDKTAVSGAMIYLTDSNGKIYNYSSTNNDGSFNLKNLPNGDFTLKVDKPGFQPYTRNIAFEKNQSYDLGDILLISEKVSPVNDRKYSSTGIMAFPNPSNDNVTLTFNSINGNTAIKVINSKGETVKSLTINSIQGSNNYSLDVSTMANGAYFVIIDNGVYSKALPISINR